MNTTTPTPATPASPDGAAHVAAVTIRAYITTIAIPDPQVASLLAHAYPDQTATVGAGYWAAQCRYSLAATGYGPETVLEALSLAAQGPDQPSDFSGARIDWDDAWHNAWEVVAQALRADYIPGEEPPVLPSSPALENYLHLD